MEEGSRIFAKVLRRFLPVYRLNHRLSAVQRRAVRAIQLCKTPGLGGREYQCQPCKRRERIYHGCRNRHCPQCQGRNSARWVEEQEKRLLPVRYYQAVFTVASELRPLFAYNRRTLYNLLFGVSSQTIDHFAADSRWLGARPAYVGILHTWGQEMVLHPHIHYMLSAGGIDAAGRWVAPRQSAPFLFPVVAMSEHFRDRFLAALERLHRQGKLLLPGGLDWSDTMARARGKAWEIFLQPPVAGADKLLCYLGRYTHRVAIHPSRIREVNDRTVRFGYRDYRRGGQWRERCLAGEQFVGRFLQHVLPAGFRRIRQYGLWHASRQEAREAIRQQLHQQTVALLTLLSAQGTLAPCRVGGPVCEVCRQPMSLGVEVPPQRIDSS